MDGVIEFYKRGVDRRAIRENLKLTPAERMEKFQRTMDARDGGRSAVVDARRVHGGTDVPPLTVHGRVLVLLDDLIERTRAAGRPEDPELTIELEAIREELEQAG